MRWILAPSALDHRQFQVLAALHINHLRPLPHDVERDGLMRVAAELHRMVRPMMTKILPALLALAMMTGAASAHQALTPHVWG